MAPSKSARLGHDVGSPLRDNKNGDSPAVAAASSTRPNTVKHRHSISTGDSAAPRDAPGTTASATAAQCQNTAKDLKSQGLQWTAFDRDVLHAYRREFRLKTPTSFARSFHHVVLSQPGGVGQFSPTMARRLGNRRQSKEQLAWTIRRHFNAMGVQEDHVIAELLYNLSREKNDSRRSPVFSWSVV